MSSATEGVDLLSIEDDEQAINIVDKIESYNTERKLITEKISKDAISKIDEREKLSTILIYSENYHEGVLGIVASNLVEKYKRPVLVAKKVEGYIKGSARSYGEFNIYEAMNKIKDKFITFGGHTSAAGFSIELQNVNDVFDKLNKLYDSYLDSTEIKIKKNIDLVVDFENISYQLLNELSTLKPFGNSFENISILSKNVLILSKENFGSDRQYLKLLLGKNNSSIEAISFKDNEVFNEIQKDDIIDIMFTLE
ncbi:single-stranded-DNA-specific exonuclease RecJ, partial [Streptococcus danieliae]|nr:single-stranded-DNA-specific exonuclease RecJ [Streptococcus danieliae]